MIIDALYHSSNIKKVLLDEYSIEGVLSIDPSFNSTPSTLSRVSLKYSLHLMGAPFHHVHRLQPTPYLHAYTLLLTPSAPDVEITDSNLCGSTIKSSTQFSELKSECYAYLQAGYIA